MYVTYAKAERNNERDKDKTYATRVRKRERERKRNDFPRATLNANLSCVRICTVSLTHTHTVSRAQGWIDVYKYEYVRARNCIYAESYLRRVKSHWRDPMAGVPWE